MPDMLLPADTAAGIVHDQTTAPTGVTYTSCRPTRADRYKVENLNLDG